MIFIGISACGVLPIPESVMKLSEAINTAEQRPFFVLGGHLAAPEPDIF
jgi:hypothetical protein